MAAPKTSRSAELDDLFADDAMDVDAKALGRLGARFDDADLDDATSPNVMAAFYRHLFPFRQLYAWLAAQPAASATANPTRLFTNREVAFELMNAVYIRYNSFATSDEMRKEVLRLIPARFEIGPVYSAKPKDRKTLQAGALKPLLRELVFDIDMDDYNAIRVCCQDKKVCRRCWAFIAMAIKVLERILRDDIGFQHLLFVYSGRRGIHVWVSDAAALALTNRQREALVDYINLVGKSRAAQTLPRPFHPAIKRGIDILGDYFKSTILVDQDLFATEKGAEDLLSKLPETCALRLISVLTHTAIATTLREQWKKQPKRSSVQKWADVRDQINSSKSKNVHDGLLQEIMLGYTYPRIDANVSKHVNHLLKSPFCIHPKTGRVCVPLAAADIESFEPTEVPTIGQLLRELEKAKVTNKDGFKAEEGGWEHTSLRPYVEFFEKHCQGIIKDARDAKKSASARSMAF